MQLRLLWFKFLILASLLNSSLSFGLACKFVFDEKAFKGISHQIRLENFSKRLQLVSETEIHERLRGRSICEVLGFERDESGRLQPIFGQDFQSRRDNLPEGTFGGTGWESDRRAEVVALTLHQYSGVKNHLNELSSILPDELRQDLQSGVPVTTTAQKYNDTQYSLLMIVTPSVGGGRTGILLKHGLPLIYRDQVTGVEFILEQKGAGTFNNLGGFRKDEVVQNASGGQSGGDWAIFGGLTLVQAEREDKFSVEDALNSNNKIENSSISLGFLEFESHIMKQAALFRLSPGTIRATFVYANSKNQNAKMRSKIVEGISHRLLKTALNFHVALTHPENFILNAKGEVYLIDYADIHHFEGFPVARAFSTIDFNTALVLSLESVRQVPGYQDKENLNDVKQGFKRALQEKGDLNSTSEKAIDEASDIYSLIRSVRLYGVNKYKVLQEKKSGLMPDRFLEALHSFAKTPWQIAKSTVEADVIQYFTTRSTFKSLDIVDQREVAISQLNAYPSKPGPETRAIEFVGAIQRGILVPLVKAGLEGGAISVGDIFTGSRLAAYLGTYLKPDLNINDLVWTRTYKEVNERDFSVAMAFDRNPYLDLYKKKLITSVPQAVQMIRLWGSRSSGSAQALQERLLSSLQSQKKYLIDIENLSPLARLSLDIAVARIDAISAMPLPEFAAKFLENPQNYFEAFFTPYNQRSILEKNFAKDFQRLMDALARNDKP